MPLSHDHRSLAEAFATIASTAAAAILDIKRGGLSTRIKADCSPVTEADEQAERVIAQALRALLPDVPLIAEEQVAAGVVPEIGDTFLLVDPLDGTREFIAGRNEYTVNIALVERGRPTVGVIAAPELGTLYAGTPSWAGRRSEGDSVFTSIVTRPLAQPPVAIASLSHCNEETREWLDRWPAIERKGIGSSLKFCLLAEGEADVYPRFSPTCEWDTAAGQAILAGAGGVVLNLDSTDMVYGKHDSGFRNGNFIAWGRRPD